MSHETILMVFVVIAALALAAQAIVVIVATAAMAKATKEGLKILHEVQDNITPVIATTRELLADVGPKAKKIATNAEEISEIVRREAANIQIAMDDIVAKVQTQAARVNEVTTNTLDAVENTRSRVQNIVDAPIRIATGLINGVTAGLDRFFTARNQRRHAFEETELEPANDLFE